jgi:hypothetical protein
MDNTALFDQVAAKLRLKSEMTAVIICLDEYMNDFFAPKGSSNIQTVFDNLPPEIGQVLKAEFLKEEVTHENQPIVNKKIDELKTKLRTMRIVQLTLAFQPDEEAIKLFSEWVKKNISPTALIDLQFDKTIVGGALIISDGQYKDYSVRKQLSGRFQIQRDEIMGLLT